LQAPLGGDIKKSVQLKLIAELWGVVIKLIKAPKRPKKNTLEINQEYFSATN
jgi:hypothetical protein